MTKRKSRPTRGPNVRNSHVEENAQRIVVKLVKAKMTANQTFLDEQSKLEPVSYGPKQSRGGSSRERMKAGSYGVGFQGPRGYGSPKGLVGKREADGEAMASITPRPSQAPTLTSHKAGSQRFAGDSTWAGETLGYDYAVPTVGEDKAMVRRMTKGRWGRWKKHKA